MHFYASELHDACRYINPVYWTLYGLIGSQLVRMQLFA